MGAADTLTADRATLAEDEVEAGRVERLFAAEEETAEDRDAAELTVKAAKLKIQTDQTVIAVDDANVKAAEENLSRCRIVSPVSGVVTERDVEVGQTINAATTSPTIYQVATNLRSLEAAASLDEADVAAVAVGQPVSVSVEAYPGETFPGRIKQVRLDAQTVNNVVTYPTIVTVPNDSLRLLPGMTASITIVTREAHDALKVPVAALRLKPSASAIAYFHIADVPNGPVVWIRSADALIAKHVVTGVSDGHFTEIIPAPGESLAPGDRVITSLVMPGDLARPSTAPTSRNPFVASPGRGGRGF